ncbi:hypothetical protein HOY80DRAFT_416157 [Tuber brumale]|nr:hypothetical protein HOY80DRAFT_416157 [Tuber brumale]
MKFMMLFLRMRLCTLFTCPAIRYLFCRSFSRRSLSRVLGLGLQMRKRLCPTHSLPISTGRTFITNASHLLLSRQFNLPRILPILTRSLPVSPRCLLPCNQCSPKPCKRNSAASPMYKISLNSSFPKDVRSHKKAWTPPFFYKDRNPLCYFLLKFLSFFLLPPIFCFFR